MTGPKLAKNCDSCATAICGADSYCCTIKWDSICVGEVGSICGKSCSGGGGSTCSHAVCSTGTSLKASCDGCATDICGVDPYCCTVFWDSICVSEVGSICGDSCG